MKALTFERSRPEPAHGQLLNSIGKDGALLFNVQATTYGQDGRAVTICCLTPCTSSRWDVTPASARAIAAELLAAADASDPAGGAT